MERDRNEETLAAALRPFGWTCTEEFWRRYYSDPWVFNLANAVERLTEQVAALSGEPTPTEPAEPWWKKAAREADLRELPPLCHPGGGAPTEGGE